MHGSMNAKNGCSFYSVCVRCCLVVFYVFGGYTERDATLRHKA